MSLAATIGESLTFYAARIQNKTISDKQGRLFLASVLLTILLRLVTEIRARQLRSSTHLFSAGRRTKDFDRYLAIEKRIGATVAPSPHRLAQKAMARGVKPDLSKLNARTRNEATKHYKILGGDVRTVTDEQIPAMIQMMKELKLRPDDVYLGSEQNRTAIQRAWKRTKQ